MKKVLRLLDHLRCPFIGSALFRTQRARPKSTLVRAGFAISLFRAFRLSRWPCAAPAVAARRARDLQSATGRF